MLSQQASQNAALNDTGCKERLVRDFGLTRDQPEKYRTGQSGGRLRPNLRAPFDRLAPCCAPLKLANHRS